MFTGRYILWWIVKRAPQVSNFIVIHTDRDRKKGVDRETVNIEVGVGWGGKWVNKHTKRGGDGSAFLRTSEIWLPPGLMGELIHRHHEGGEGGKEGGKGEVRRISQFSLWTASSPLRLPIIHTFSSAVLSPPALSVSQPVSQSACEVALNVSIWIVIEIKDVEIDRECKKGREEAQERGECHKDSVYGWVWPLLTVLAAISGHTLPTHKHIHSHSTQRSYKEENKERCGERRFSHWGVM